MKVPRISLASSTNPSLPAEMAATESKHLSAERLG